MKTKIFYKKEIHTIDLTLIQNYQQFYSLVKSTFQKLPKHITFKIHNEKGSIIDEITFNSLHKLSIALSKICIVDSTQPQITQISICESEFSRLEFDPQQQHPCSIGLEAAMSDHKNLISLIRTSHVPDQQPRFLFQEQKPDSIVFNMREVKVQPISIKKQQNIVCNDVQCDLCFAFPVIGPIYKCLVCQQFDLCQNCEQKYHHFHPTLKIQQDRHYPTKISVIFTNKQKKYMESKHQEQQLAIKRQKQKCLHPNKKTDEIQIDADMLDSKTRTAKNFLYALGF